MNDENKHIEQQPAQHEESSSPKTKEKISIQRGPGYVPGLLDADDEDNLRKKPVYIDSRKKRLPPWAVALVVFLALMSSLFIIIPRFIEKKQNQPIPINPVTTNPSETGEPVERNTAVVKVSSAPLFDSTDSNAVRIGEALLNERVTMVDTEHRTMIKIKLDDGTEGYMSRAHLSADLMSLSLSSSLFKVVVRTPMKRVMSHARSGSLLVEAPMGTILYADYRNADLLRVKLPEGKTGWINSTGVLLLEPDGQVIADDFQQQFTSALMAFFNRPIIPGGVTTRGISPEGAIFIAGRLNGLDLPRTLGPLSSQGQAVSLSTGEDGLKNLSELQEGDLLFFHKKDDAAVIESVAICVEDQQLLIAFPNQQALRLIDLESSRARELASRIVSVRRLEKKITPPSE